MEIVRCLIRQKLGWTLNYIVMYSRIGQQGISNINYAAIFK